MQQKAGVCLHNTMQQRPASGAKLELNALAPETRISSAISSVLPSPAKDRTNEPPCPRTPHWYLCRVLSSLPRVCFAHAAAPEGAKPSLA